MPSKNYSDFSLQKADSEAFSVRQQVAIAIYREARKQQRKLQIAAVFQLVIVAGVAAMLDMFSADNGTDPTVLDEPWVTYGIPCLGMFIVLATIAFSFFIVLRAKAFMRASAVPEDFIRALKRYPSKEM
ncbi:hypothetical protein [Caballeronia sp. LZ043]|uniref:hypothetical protein n=1 Tax=Caballeronia sp. LZ043 TaxID=3038569 RepID=UPI00285D5A84|nr:hypothetical protein [Caballeronia sp. LZ043]MDR5826034.1 hypothetical protein [Caballeronia sp. LZ043]